MKKVIIMLAAALAFAACSKVEINKPNHDSLISFQTAQYLTKAVTGTVVPTTETFGTYAWTAGTTGEYFMNNVKVAFASNAWNPVTPYYWPKDQTVDFFSYYPYGMQGLTVGKDTIRYAGIDFAANQMDIMYADKAVGYYDNDDDVDDGVNAYKGVPTYFRHAGCKVKFVVVLGYDKKIDTTHTATGIDSTITKWEVTLQPCPVSTPGADANWSCLLLTTAS